MSKHRLIEELDCVESILIESVGELRDVISAVDRVAKILKGIEKRYNVYFVPDIKDLSSMVKFDVEAMHDYGEKAKKKGVKFTYNAKTKKFKFEDMKKDLHDEVYRTLSDFAAKLKTMSKRYPWLDPKEIIEPFLKIKAKAFDGDDEPEFGVML